MSTDWRLEWNFSLVLTLPVSLTWRVFFGRRRWKCWAFYRPFFGSSHPRVDLEGILSSATTLTGPRAEDPQNRQKKEKKRKVDGLRSDGPIWGGQEAQVQGDIFCLALTFIGDYTHLFFLVKKLRDYRWGNSWAIACDWGQQWRQPGKVATSGARTYNVQLHPYTSASEYYNSKRT